MSLKQIGLLTAGAQPWSPRMCTANGDRFAYCSTLATYIYEWNSDLRKFILHSVVAAHKKTITSISWNPRDKNILASASTDKEIILWDISEQRVLFRLKEIKEAPICVEWCPHEKDVVAFVYGCGPLFLWNCGASQEVTSHKETFSFYSEITQFSWNHKRTGKIAFGHKDGSLSFLNPGKKAQKHILRPESLEENGDDEPVQMLEWDSLSFDYLLVAYKNRSGIKLIDTESCNIIMNFKLPSAAARISGFSWIFNAPGMFVSGDTQSGVLRIWSASKDSPVLNLKIKETGFHSVCVIPDALVADNIKLKSNVSAASSTSLSSGKSSSGRSQTYEIPPARVVCTFLDGGIGLYDIHKRQWDFLRDYGHIETIFDCKFHPDDPDLLATCSFDGTIKVWNIQTMEAVKSTSRNETAIYSVSWAPGDLNCLVAATSRSGCFIWDVEKERIIMRFNEHGKASVYTASWNQRDSKYIASVGSDNNCIVRMVDGTLVKKYKHPGPVFGCDWSPNNRDLLATGCDDKLVRVFYLPSKGETAIRTFAGHTSKVFHVKWSPLRDGILCSGSDDTTIRIWDYSQESCVTVLEGHSAPVRGLLWHPELPEVLVSGSWDYSLRIWNVKSGYCIERNTDHAADVYGLTCHRQRPFILASSSRDSTVRIWALDYFTKPLYLHLLCGYPFSDVLQVQPAGEEESGVVPQNHWKLSGTFSSHVNSLTEHEADRNCRKVAKLFSQLFLPPFGLKNLWVLVSVLLDDDQMHLPLDYNKGIMHTRHAVRYRASQAQELETVRANNYGFSIGKPSKDAQLLEAADLQLKMGQLERYCEIMLELGEWDKALAVAPGVSIDYWRSLSKRRADQLILEDSIESVPYCVAAGQIEQLIGFFINRCQLQDAVMIAQAACEGYFSDVLTHDQNQNLNSKSLKREEAVVNGESYLAQAGPRLLQETSERLADWYFKDAQPVLSACCHLAVGDVKNAISKLIRANELELAVSLCRIMPDAKSLLEVPTLLLAKRCERFGRWNDALSLINSLENKETNHVMKLCARFSGTNQEVNDFHAKASLPSMEDCQSEANKLKEANNMIDALQYMILSPHPEHALEVGISLIKGIFAKKSWSLDDVLPITDLLSSIRSEKLQQGKLSRLRNELLVITAYTGALHAIRKKCFSVVVPLFQAASYLLTKDKVEAGIKQAQIQAESEAWLVHWLQTRNSPSSRTQAPLPSDDQTHVWNAMKSRIGNEPNEYDCGEYIVAGSHFPSHSLLAHLSMFTKRKIKGHVFYLEDGFSALPYNEALMWARVNSFSPLGSGLRINPF